MNDQKLITELAKDLYTVKEELDSLNRTSELYRKWWMDELESANLLKSEMSDLKSELAEFRGLIKENNKK